VNYQILNSDLDEHGFLLFNNYQNEVDLIFYTGFSPLNFYQELPILCNNKKNLIFFKFV
jgi:hypothetical protein